jgi:hypothetical protein
VVSGGIVVSGVVEVASGAISGVDVAGGVEVASGGVEVATGGVEVASGAISGVDVASSDTAGVEVAWPCKSWPTTALTSPALTVVDDVVATGLFCVCKCLVETMTAAGLDSTVAATSGTASGMTGL